MSNKFFEWTGERWIITFSKKKGDITIKEKELNKMKKLIKEAEKTELYKNMIKEFPDANLIEVNSKEQKEE